MCYSAESSLLSFLVGSTGSIYLLNSNNNTNKHIGLFLLSVSIIQFLEFLMWIDQKCGILNSIASRSIILVLSLQLYVIFLGGYLYDTLIIPKKILKILLIPLTLGFIYMSSYNYFDKRKWCSKPNKDRSLLWANRKDISIFYTYIYYALFLIMPFLVKELWKGLLIFTFGIISFLLTRYKTEGTSNSRWCYYSAFMPLIFVILDYYKL